MDGETYFANQPFTFVTRKRGVDSGDARTGRSATTEERNFCGIASVADAKGGVALVGGEGLHEVAVKDDEEGTVAMTLIRAFKRTVMLPYTGRGQLQQEDELDVADSAVCGESRTWRRSRGCRTSYHAGVRTAFVRGAGEEAGTFVAIEKGAAMLSACKIAEDRDGVILRLYNPTDKAVKDTVRLGKAFQSAVEVNSAEEAVEGAKEQRGGKTLSVELGAQKIGTWRVKF